MYCSEAANFLVPVMLISAISKLQRVAAASGSIGGGVRDGTVSRGPTKCTSRILNAMSPNQVRSPHVVVAIRW